MQADNSNDDRARLESELAHLRQEHRDLDDAILALEHLGSPDKLQIQRLKKKKLLLKDEIAKLKNGTIH